MVRAESHEFKPSDAFHGYPSIASPGNRGVNLLGRLHISPLLATSTRSYPSLDTRHTLTICAWIESLALLYTACLPRVFDGLCLGIGIVQPGQPWSGSASVELSGGRTTETSRSHLRGVRDMVRSHFSNSVRLGCDALKHWRERTLRRTPQRRAM